jgi:uncharacterized protein YecE (DUF72 family)
MKLHVGTSGYSYKEWKGSFYPEKIKPDEMLSYYASRLPAVEINNTFYRMPKKDVLETWASQVPERFRFSVKASRRITHMKQLRGVEDEVGFLLDNLTVLGDRLGVVLFQTPPTLKKDLDRLDVFLSLLPEGGKFVFEFRHDSWLEDDAVERLKGRGCALCVSDTDEQDAELIPTADFGYLRLRKEAYDKAALKKWSKRVADQGWSEAFVFFKHEDEGAGAAQAMQFLEIAK